MMLMPLSGESRLTPVSENAFWLCIVEISRIAVLNSFSSSLSEAGLSVKLEPPVVSVLSEVEPLSLLGLSSLFKSSSLLGLSSLL